MSEDITRLPKWAQRQITSLMQQVASKDRQIAELTAGPEDSNTFADPYFPGGKGMRPLGASPMIRFGGTDYCQTFDVQFEDGGLTLRGNSMSSNTMPVLLPVHSNEFRYVFIPRDLT